MKNRGLYLIAALLLASMACQTIMDPITDSADLDLDWMIEPVATDWIEEADPDSLLEPAATEPESEMEFTDEQAGGEVLLRDDFEDPSSGWEVGDHEAGSIGYGSDAYFVIALGNSDFMWGVANETFEDVIIEVEARQVRAPANDNNGYGVMCRYQGRAGYMFRISGDGFYTISKWSDGELVPLVDWTTSDAINLGNASNQMRVTCDGATLSLEVNGEHLASTQDTEFSNGDLALVAISYEEDPTEIHFDNFIATAP